MDNRQKPFGGTDNSLPDEQYYRQLKQYSEMDNTDYFDSYVDLEFQQYDNYKAKQQPSYSRPAQRTRRSPAASHRSSDPGRARRDPPSRRKRGGFGGKTEKHHTRNSQNKHSHAFQRNDAAVAQENRAPVRSEQIKGGDKSLEGRKKKSLLKRILITALVLVFTGFIIYNLLALYLVSKVNVVETKKRDDSISATLKSDDVKNILIIGSDTRDMKELGRTDSMIVLSINTKKKQMTIMSLMRDMYLPLVGYANDGTKMYDDEEPDGLYRNKLNSAFVFGGAELLMDTIKYNFGIEIDDYVYFDFESFIQIIDAIGGIELEISDAEAKVMNDYIKEQNKVLKKDPNEGLLSSSGKQTVNGNQALAYSRIRYVGNADFERTQRQRNVMMNVITKTKDSSIFKKYGFAKAATKDLTTNMKKSQLFSYAYKLPFYMDYELKELRIPADGYYEFGSHKGGQSTVDIDIEKCRQLIKKELYD